MNFNDEQKSYNKWIKNDFLPAAIQAKRVNKFGSSSLLQRASLRVRSMLSKTVRLHMELRFFLI